MKIRQLAPLVVSLSGCSLLFAPDQYQDGDSGPLRDGGHDDTAVVEASTFDGTAIDAPAVDAEGTLDDATTDAPRVDARRVDADRDGAAEPDGDQWPTCGDGVGDATLSNALGDSITLSSAFLTWTGLRLEGAEAGLLGADHNGIELFAANGGSSPFLQVAVAVVAPASGTPNPSIVRVGALTSQALHLQDLDLESGQPSGAVTSLQPMNSMALRAFALADDGSRVAILGESSTREETFGWVCEADGSHCDELTIPPGPPNRGAIADEITGVAFTREGTDPRLVLMGRRGSTACTEDGGCPAGRVSVSPLATIDYSSLMNGHDQAFFSRIVTAGPAFLVGAYTHNDPWIFVDGWARQLTTTAGIADMFARARGAGGGFGLATDDLGGYALFVATAVGTSGTTQIIRRSTSCDETGCGCPVRTDACDTPLTTTNDVAIGAARQGSVYYIDPLHPADSGVGHLLVLGEDPEIPKARGTDVTLRFAGPTAGETLGADDIGELVISSGRVGGARGRLYDLRAVATRQASEALTVIAVAAVEIPDLSVATQRIYVSGLRVCGHH